MASRTWLAVSLMLLIWFGWIRWFSPVPPQKPSATDTRLVESGGSNLSQEKPSVSSQTSTASEKVAHDSAFSPIPEGSKLNLRTDALDVLFSSNGGKIAGVKLLKFRETIDKKSPLVTPIETAKTTLALAALFTDPVLSEFSRGSFDAQQSANQVVFTKKTKDISVSKQYRFSENSNFIEANFKISFLKEDRKDWGSLLIPLGTSEQETFNAQEPLKSWEVVFYQNDEIQRRNLEKLRKEDESVHQGKSEWLAFGNRYFASVVINQSSQINPDVVFKKTENFNGAYLKYPLILKSGQRELDFSLKFYVGPKDYKELSKIPGLKKLIDYGTFTVFAYPLLEILRFFYKFIHNYGIAIILLTVLVRALFYPLSQKSMKSMKEMQKLQPKIAQLKEKYKDDPKKLNEEQMALFKAHKVNPAGGCLPMLIQLPVFIALYAVLGNSIELFHAPFFGWIQDLSTKDPFYIYPILMGLAMLLQQKMTPSAGMDPAQQKMMLFMPVIFTFMMVNLPSGLTLYIFVSTLLGVAQQLALRDKIGTGLQPS